MARMITNFKHLKITFISSILDTEDSSEHLKFNTNYKEVELSAPKLTALIVLYFSVYCNTKGVA